MDESFKITVRNKYKENGESSNQGSVYNQKKDTRHSVKLFIQDILQLEPHPEKEGFYSFRGLPIQFVYICGVITETKRIKDKILYTVDDGSGEMGCLYNHERHAKYFNKHKAMDSLNINNICEPIMDDTITESENDSYKTTELELVKWIKEKWDIKAKSISLPFNLGDSIMGYGKLHDFRGERQMWMFDVRLITDFDDETNWKFELFHLYSKVYNKLPNIEDCKF